MPKALVEEHVCDQGPRPGEHMPPIVRDGQQADNRVVKVGIFPAVKNSKENPHEGDHQEDGNIDNNDLIDHITKSEFPSVVVPDLLKHIFFGAAL